MMSEREYQARERILIGRIGGKTHTHHIHGVTFKPQGSGTNQDRMVIQKWDILNDEWLFLAVFDGHLGSATSDYTSKMLPTFIQRRLHSFIEGIGGRLDRGNVAQHGSRVTALLEHEIQSFDKAIGDALRAICPDPSTLSAEQARRLIEKHQNIVQRAFSGTTLAFALVNPRQRFLWAAGLGDSTVGLSTTDRQGRIQVHRLCDMHTFQDPKEYFRAAMSHPTSEKDIIDWDNRMLGWMAVPRSIGGFALKLHASYLDHVFRYMGFTANPPIETHVPKIKTPPYVTSEPSVRFTDLQPYWGKNSHVILFTDGVDNLVDGYFVFRPMGHSHANPLEVVAELLRDDIDPRIETILGHAVQPRWSGAEDNRATDVLGNLLGGTNLERLEMVSDVDRHDDPDADCMFHIDDTTIIIWPVKDE
ncbi:protein serine/threonine phosphatase 2C [Trametes elegans]|nr:protein serine/threonine phosphatase 2C [Trametes elegans]